MLLPLPVDDENFRHGAFHRTEVESCHCPERNTTARVVVLPVIAVAATVVRAVANTVSIAVDMVVVTERMVPLLWLLSVRLWMVVAPFWVLSHSGIRHDDVVRILPRVVPSLETKQFEKLDIGLSLSICRHWKVDGWHGGALVDAVELQM